VVICDTKLQQKKTCVVARVIGFYSLHDSTGFKVKSTCEDSGIVSYSTVPAKRIYVHIKV
jgi:hypothetical protein